MRMIEMFIAPCIYKGWAGYQTR